MVQQTPNHNLDYDYAEGDDWDLNQEMQIIEQRLVIRDIESEVDTYTAYDGAIFIAKDTGRVFDGNGTEWTEAGRKFDALEVRTAGIETLVGSLTGGDNVTSLVGDGLSVNTQTGELEAAGGGGGSSDTILDYADSSRDIAFTTESDPANVPTPPPDTTVIQLPDN